jgi:hypothetical protein
MSVVIQPFNQSYTADVQNLILNIQQAEFNLPISLPDQPDLEDISKTLTGLDSTNLVLISCGCTLITFVRFLIMYSPVSFLLVAILLFISG